MPSALLRHFAVFGGSAMPVLSGRRFGGALAFSLALLAGGHAGEGGGYAVGTAAPPTLHDTGLYTAPDALTIDPAHLGFAPQYPLWTDGATKRRWISLPPGDVIDASNPDAWEFPIGTRFWKEFAFDGRPVESRFMQRLADGSWLFASYAWNAAGTQATLAPVRGISRAHAFADGSAHAIPGEAECKACHLSGGGPVLGFGTLQLSDDRDPNALHAEPAPPPGLTLSALAARGMVAGLDRALLLAPPRSSTASATQRAALGYLHGNCGHCHNAYGPLRGLGLYLRNESGPRRAGALDTAFRRMLVRPPPGLHPGTHQRIAPGLPGLSAIPQRMAARGSALQMPPIGTARIDAEGIDLINRWIAGARIPHASVRHNVSD